MLTSTTVVFEIPQKKEFLSHKKSTEKNANRFSRKMIKMQITWGMMRVKYFELFLTKCILDIDAKCCDCWYSWNELWNPLIHTLCATVYNSKQQISMSTNLTQYNIMQHTIQQIARKSANWQFGKSNKKATHNCYKINNHWKYSVKKENKLFQ